ncbi:MAG: trigger factor [Streptosporangiaceae bacterium]
MKTDVEELSPTRVRLTVEVPFEDLKPSLDHAYREVARQVRIPGFRPGHVPRPVLDQRVGRGAVLEHAINDAVPELYAQAVRESKVVALGQPEVEITKLEDGTELAFTAEVDIRPGFEVPDLATLRVEVDDAEVTPDEVEEYLTALRERFASLRTADRPAEHGDYVSIDLSAEVDGAAVEDAQATGISYEVGSGTILEGLDDALVGMATDDTATFLTTLVGGEHAGETADVTVTVRGVKVKDLPELDDEFAQSASEFNTVGELRSNTRKQMEAMRQAGQAGQARDRAVEALLEMIDMPLPQALVDDEIAHRNESLQVDLERAGLTMETFLDSRSTTQADLEKEIADDVRRSMKARFILDQIAENEEIGVEQDELAQYVTQLAYQQGVAPDALAQQLTNAGQLGMVVADVLRSKAAGLLAERATVVDASGRPVVLGDEAAAEDGDGAGEDAGTDSEAAAETGGKGRRGGRAAKSSDAESGKAKGRGRSKRAAKDAEAGDAEAEPEQAAPEAAAPAE